MAKKKDFRAGGPVPAPVIPIIPVQAISAAGRSRVTIPLGNGRMKEVDFAEYLGRGFEDTVLAIAGVFKAMVVAGRPAPLSLETIVNSGLVKWWSFCSELAQQGEPPTLRSIDGSTMETYAGWLSMRLKPDGERWSRRPRRY